MNFRALYFLYLFFFHVHQPTANPSVIFYNLRLRWLGKFPNWTSCKLEMLTGPSRLWLWTKWGRQSTEGCGPFRNSNFQESQVTDLKLKLGGMREVGVSVNMEAKSVFWRGWKMVWIVPSLVLGVATWCTMGEICVCFLVCFVLLFVSPLPAGLLQLQ